MRTHGGRLSPLLRFFLIYSVLMTLVGMQLAHAGDCPDTVDVPARVMCEAKAEKVIDKDGFLAVDIEKAEKFLEKEFPIYTDLRTCILVRFAYEGNALEPSMQACTLIYRPVVYNIPHKD